MKRYHMRILLVEDNVPEAVVLRELLHRAPDVEIDLVHVESFEAGKAIAAKGNTDVILLDLFLPDSCGLQTITCMNDAAPSVPIVALTSSNDNGLSLEAVRTGAQDYLVKGQIDGSLLVRALRYAIDRKQAQEQLRQSEEHFRTLIENSLDIITVLNQDGTIRYASPSVKRVLGYAPKELLRKNAFELVHPDDVSDLRTIFLHVIQNPGFVGFAEFRFRRKEGSWCVLESIGKYLQESECGVVVNARDITERRETQEALQESQEQYRRIVETAQEGIWMIDARNRTSFVNKKMAEMLGYTVDEMMGVPLFHFMDEEARSRAAVTLERRRQGISEQLEIKYRRKDGTGMWAHLSTNPIFDNEGRYAGALAMVIDITERKRADEELRASEERYRLLFEENLTGNFVSTPDGVLLSCNPAFARIFGFASVEEAMQSNMKSLYQDDSQRERLLAQLLTEKRIEHYEQVLRRRDGTLIHVIENVIGTFDAHGELIEIKGYLFDDTKRKQLEEQMLQMQKMESIGTLAGGIAHDFNNILGIILGHSTMLDALVDTPGKLAGSIEAINKAVQRGSGLVRQILTFARKTNVLFEPVQLNELIVEMRKMLEGTFPKTIEVFLQLEKGIPFIDADPTQLHQALLNLCVNARDAMPDGGTLLISTTKATSDQLREQGRDATAAEYVHVRVSDTGEGMDEQTKQRIFEPFFTTKEIGKGTGLGLSVVYGIMKSHRGYIDVETARGRGTTFHLYFPIPGTTSESDNNEKKNSEAAGGSETILLVEDEDMLRELVSNLLQAKGYRVLTAANGIEALDLFAKAHNEIALVLTDMGLPKMSGLEMVKRIRGASPAMKVILASGYLPAEQKFEVETIGAHEFVEKPYLPDELFRKIRQVIDGHTSPSAISCNSSP